MSQSWIKSVLFSLGMVVTGQRAIATESPPPKTESAATAIFAGGCFWCTESDFEKVPGVIDAQSGYTGGKAVNPTYEQVSAGGTGHTEAVRVTYDPARVSTEELAALEAKLPSTYIVLSPFEGLDTPIALSAWNAQLKIASTADPRVEEFLEEYWRNQHVPEPTSACTGAIDGPGRR